MVLITGRNGGLGVLLPTLLALRNSDDMTEEDVRKV